MADERNRLKISDENEASPERWLLSYSDLVTTLMVLFLALYAIQLAKNRELEVKMLETTHSVKAQSASAAASPNAGDARARTELLSLLKALHDKGQININEEPDGVEIAINARILFHAGDAHLLPDSYDVLEQVAAALKDHSTHNILVEGHTDSTPIATAKYESNWELSSARAGAVVRYFVDQGIEPHRLAAIGRSDNIPLMIGDDAAARAANRRVTILVQY
ncbi:MAG: OmpA family protein [Paraburkholderia sp.]|uniref:OmpA/MotB family protein n=1 Tax=Paraburkholderia sp. TaxID=1926495 RepID=UPI003C373F8A